MPIVGKLTDILSGPLGALAIQHLRVRPRQERSIESLERILSAAAAIAFDHKSIENINIEKIAVAAGVTPQAAYRYFRDADELIRTALRCAVVHDHEKLIVLLSNRVLSDVSEMARVVVGIVLDACENLQRYPVHLQADVLQEYRQVGFDASRLMSELVCKDVDETDIRRSLDVVKMSVALTAIIAVATSASSKKALLRGSKLEDMLTDLFVSVLQSDGSAFDAFREMGVDFDAF